MSDEEEIARWATLHGASPVGEEVFAEIPTEQSILSDLRDLGLVE